MYKYSSLINKRSIIVPASGCRINRQRVKIYVYVYRRGTHIARGQRANKVIQPVLVISLDQHFVLGTST